MLKLVVYLVSILKLIALGRWIQPGHVRDVSAADFNILVESVNNLAGNLDEVARQTEATRKKVYRDEVKSDGDRFIPAPAIKESVLPNLQAGDEVPPGIF